MTIDEPTASLIVPEYEFGRRSIACVCSRFEQLQSLPVATQMMVRLGADVVKVEPTKLANRSPLAACRHGYVGPSGRSYISSLQPRQAKHRH